MYPKSLCCEAESSGQHYLLYIPKIDDLGRRTPSRRHFGETNPNYREDFKDLNETSGHPDLDTSSLNIILHAARLHRAGKVRRVLVAAGNIPWLPAIKAEAELIRELLMTWGVPPGDIEIAGASRNTYENAIEIRDLRRARPFETALLVTSASHMPRALAVFRKAGLPVEPATTDIEVVDVPGGDLLRWLPDAGALAMTSTAVKEWIGCWGYWARGYV